MTSEYELASCEGKRSFATWSQAKATADRIKRQKDCKDQPPAPYRCKLCGHYHIGRPRPRNDKLKRPYHRKDPDP